MNNILKINNNEQTEIIQELPYEQQVTKKSIDKRKLRYNTTNPTPEHIEAVAKRLQQIENKIAKMSKVIERCKSKAEIRNALYNSYLIKSHIMKQKLAEMELKVKLDNTKEVQ